MSRKQYIQTELYSFACMPGWHERLDELAEMAVPEPWRFKEAHSECRNEKTPILDRYIREVFRMQATAFNAASDEWEEGGMFAIGSRCACFHTGLFTKAYKPIYACFEPNKRMDSTLMWYFKAFADDSSAVLKHVSPLPGSLIHSLSAAGGRYNPSWRIRMNFKHVLEDTDNIERIPEEMRRIKFLPLLMETAVELGRRRAMMEPGLAVPQLYRGRMQYLLPISLTDMSRTDLAVTLSPMEGYYQGETCLTPQMAYINARILGRPTAHWLKEMVE